MRTFRALAVIAISLAAISLDCHVPEAVAASPDVVARERASCIQMGLNPTEEDFDECMISLNRTVEELEEAKLVQTYREKCVQQGFDIGTVPFALCVVKMQNAAEESHRRD
jgi:hypothetical protein